jgi:hypothetical protein
LKKRAIEPKPRRRAARVAKRSARCTGLRWPAFEIRRARRVQPQLVVAYSAIRTSSPEREQLNVQVPQIKRGVALVFADPGASFKMYLKNAFQVFAFQVFMKEITMTNSPGSASGDQKPNTPANP